MTFRDRHPLLTLALFLLGAATTHAQTSLTVVSEQPNGEIASLAETNEIRVRFSEPMVPLGRIPEQVQAPFFSVRPSVRRRSTRIASRGARKWLSSA